MKTIAKLLCGALLLSGCATTGADSEIGETVFTGFSEKSDGTKTQTMRGLVCLPEVGDMRLARAELLKPDGSDAFCNYTDGNSDFFTVYLSDFPDWSPEDYFKVSVNDTRIVMDSAGLTIDTDLSEHCELSFIDKTSVLKAFSTIEDSVMTLDQDPAVVFSRSNRLSILTLTETAERQYLKFRYSLSGAGEADTKVACDFLRGQSLFHQRNIRDESGEALSEEEMMQRLLQNLIAKEE